MFIILEKWGYRSQLVLFHFIEYRLRQLNNKHMKRAVNLTKQFFESRCQKKYLIKVWIFLAHPPQNDGPVIFFVKLNGNHVLMANIFRLYKLRHLVYWKCIIWAKSDLLIIKSVCEKVWFTINGLSKMLFHFIAFFIFPNFKWLLSKLLQKNLPFFIMDFEGSVLLRRKYFWSIYFPFF